MFRVMPILLILAASSCGVPCPAIACLRTLTVEFADAAGNALAPTSVSEASGTTHTCTGDGTCTANSLSFQTTVNSATTSVRAVATTGESFFGEVTPVWKPTRTVTPGSCECAGEAATVKVTLR